MEKDNGEQAFSEKELAFFHGLRADNKWGAQSRDNSEWATRQWAAYRKAVSQVATIEDLRSATDSLGYSVVRTIPGLVAWNDELQIGIQRAEKRIHELRADLLESAKQRREIEAKLSGAEKMILKLTPKPKEDSLGYLQFKDSGKDSQGAGKDDGQQAVLGG